MGGIAENTYDPGGRVIASESWGTAGGAVPADRAGTNNVMLAGSLSRFDEGGRQYESQQNLFLTTGLSGGAPVHTLASGRSVTHGGGGLAANSTANNHFGSTVLTAGGTSYLLSRTVFDRAGRTSITAADNTALTSYAYDGADRRLSATDALGNVSASTYDPNSNVTAATSTQAVHDLQFHPDRELRQPDAL